jgi:flavin-dependent dehydrogenase
MKFDIVVVGSGPSGASAALVCSQHGLNVCVVSEHSRSGFYDHIDVSHSVHPGTIELASRLGLSESFQKSTLSDFNGIHIGESTQYFDKDEFWKGRHICKKTLDLSLKEKLLRINNVTFLNASIMNFTTHINSVALITSSGELECRYVVDATGRSRYFGKNLKIKERNFSKNLLAFTGRSTISSGDYKDSCPFFSFEQDGWLWLAPDREDSLTWTRLFVDFAGIKDDVNSKKYVNGKGFNTTWRLFRPVVHSNIVLTGDAAGILDPSAGQGIFNALVSGANAGNCVSNCILDPSNSTYHQVSYDKWFLDHFKNKVTLLSQHYKSNGLDISRGHAKTSRGKTLQ